MSSDLKKEGAADESRAGQPGSPKNQIGSKRKKHALPEPFQLKPVGNGKSK